MRQRTRARRGAGIPATKYRAADGGCSAREESRFSPKRETNTCAVSPAPEGAKRGHGRGLAERNPFRRGGLHRTRPRSRICIRRVGRRTPESTALARRARLPEPKPHDVRQTNTQHKARSAAKAQPTTANQNLRLRERITKSAPMRIARTHETPITIANALPCCWNGSGMFMP